MKTKRIEQFVKEYFYFSQTERKGIIGLLILLVVVIALPSIYEIVFPPKPFDLTIETINPTESSTDLRVVKVESLFPFNPNTASPAELKKLGFSDKNIQTLHRYLAKGGKFKTPDDLNKMFGLDKNLVQKLIPFVELGNNTPFKQNSGFADTTHQKKYVNKAPLELNSADTNALIALYKIGPSMARRIVEYRDKLGGFLSLNQLTEIFGFDEDILYDLKGKIYVDATKATIFDVNTVTLDQLKTHPYFKYKLSNAIINYRMQHGNYQSLPQLKNIVIVNDSIYKNITQYLKLK